MSTWTKRNLCIAGGILCIGNFIGIGISDAMLGGDAVNGKQEGSRYFVASHGKYTEVSE